MDSCNGQTCDSEYGLMQRRRYLRSDGCGSRVYLAALRYRAEMRFQSEVPV